MGKYDPNKIPINIYITEAQKAWLQKKAKERECPMAYIMRQCVSIQMQKDQSKED